MLRSEEHTSELQSPCNLVCRLFLSSSLPSSTLPPYTTLFRSLNNIEGATATAPPPANSTESAPHFGARAIGEHVLQVTLQDEDNSFPALVAHPVFRPVKLPDAEIGRAHV